MNKKYSKCTTFERLKCNWCGEYFFLPPSEVKRRKLSTVCCSFSCRSKLAQKDGGRNFKTGTMRHKGYVLEWQPTHPRNVKGYVYQHRLVMEKQLGRFLDKEEVVHHMNHKRDDNSLENLQIMSHEDHMAVHSVVKVNLKGRLMGWGKACEELGVKRESAYSHRTRKGMTHQEFIDGFLKGFK